MTKVFSLFHELGSEQMRGVGRPSMLQPEWGCGDPTAPHGSADN